MSIETVLVFPLLLWCFGATFQFWDVFYAKNSAQNAAFTVADAISRETDDIDDVYIEGMNDVHGYLTKSSWPVEMRVTAIRWDEDDNQYEFDWSYSTIETFKPMHTVATLNALSSQIPIMADGDMAVLVETWMVYEPFVRVGLDPMMIENVVVTRPRFAPQIGWSGPLTAEWKDDIIEDGSDDDTPGDPDDDDEPAT